MHSLPRSLRSLGTPATARRPPSLSHRARSSPRAGFTEKGCAGGRGTAPLNSGFPLIPSVPSLARLALCSPVSSCVLDRARHSGLASSFRHPALSYALHATTPPTTEPSPIPSIRAGGGGDRQPVPSPLALWARPHGARHARGLPCTPSTMRLWGRGFAGAPLACPQGVATRPPPVGFAPVPPASRLAARALRSASGGRYIGETSDFLNYREQSSPARPPLAIIK